jgi:hypothetical protein
MQNKNRIHAEVLESFRRELFEEAVLHDGDTIGTDDESLLCRSSVLKL